MTQELNENSDRDFAQEIFCPRGVFQLLFWEGAFSLAFETWTGPTYFSGLAGEMGIGVRLLSLIMVVPWLGVFGQFLSLEAYQRSSSVRFYVIRMASLSRALWLLPIGAGWYWGVRAALAGAPFPTERWFVFATVISGLSQWIGASSGAAWWSWVRELVSPKVRGRFFGTRQRYTYAAVILVHVMGVFWAGFRPKGYPAGFGILLICALVSAALSTYFLSRVPDAGGGPQNPESKTLAEMVREPLRDPAFVRLLAFNAVFQGAVQLASPFFPYYFTRELHLPMSEVVFWTVMTNVGWFLTASFWGRKIDAPGGGRKAFWLTANLVALSPLFYVFAGARAVSIFAPWDYLVNGMAWAGYTLVYTQLSLERSRGARCAAYFAVSSGATALASVVGNLAGGELACVLAPLLSLTGGGGGILSGSAGSFRVLFFASSLARFATVWGLGHLLFSKDRIMGEAAVIPLRVIHRVVQSATLFAKHRALND